MSHRHKFINCVVALSAVLLPFTETCPPSLASPFDEIKVKTPKPPEPPRLGHNPFEKARKDAEGEAKRAGSHLSKSAQQARDRAIQEVQRKQREAEHRANMARRAQQEAIARSQAEFKRRQIQAEQQRKQQQDLANAIATAANRLIQGQPEGIPVPPSPYVTPVPTPIHSATNAARDLSNGAAVVGGEIAREWNNVRQDAEREARSGWNAARDGAQQIIAGSQAIIPPLKKFDPDEIVAQVQHALNQEVTDQLQQNSVMYDDQSGELDLRGTRMCDVLDHWLGMFAQGNKSEGKVRTFSFNAKTRKLRIELYARHCQSLSGNQNISMMNQNLYEVRQSATFCYDFKESKGAFDINFGSLSPPLQSESLVKLTEGDLVGAAETMTPEKGGQLLGIERENDYDRVVRSYADKYGTQNVYFATQHFVNWASPDTLRRYGISAVVSHGASIEATMEKVREESIKELKAVGAWLEQKGIQFGDAERVATDLLTGRGIRSPYIKLEIVPVRYSARENPEWSHVKTPWRHEDHLGFVIVWQNPASDPASQSQANTVQLVGGQVGTTTVESLKATPNYPTISLPPGEAYASNLGIHYTKVMYDDGTFGAYVSRLPAPNTPASQLGLEPGDVVFELDGMRFRTENDVLSHRYETSVRLVDVRTKQSVSHLVNIP